MKFSSNFTFVLLFPLLLVAACSSIPKSSIQVSDPHLKCLAEAIHGEARGESQAGKVFVGRVIMTRLSERFASNLCGVVYAKYQFAPRRDFGQASLDAARESIKQGPNGVTHFHSYAQKKSPEAGFSSSPKCLFKTKVGAHWGYFCSARNILGRAPASKSR